jgi:hypothetical protein
MVSDSSNGAHKKLQKASHRTCLETDVDTGTTVPCIRTENMRLPRGNTFSHRQMLHTVRSTAAALLPLTSVCPLCWLAYPSFLLFFHPDHFVNQGK